MQIVFGFAKAVLFMTAQVGVMIGVVWLVVRLSRRRTRPTHDR
jgi:hypothetical protein